MITGIYGGSFNPFTSGHADIVSRALGVVDELHIVVGKNILKPNAAEEIESRVAAIRALYRDEPRVRVLSRDGILALYAQSLARSLEGRVVFVRGLRNASDLEAETPMAYVNRAKYGVETLFLLADPSLSFVSSSIVRELESFGEDAGEFLPHPLEP